MSRPGQRRALWALLLLALMAWAPAAGAVEPREELKNPVLEARAEAVGKELRCLVCQNESIEDSSADLAHDLRVLLRQRIAAGDTDQQAVQYIVARYGQFVLLKPPVEPATYVLWFGPAALLGLAGLATLFYLRRHAPGRGAEPPPLSEAERRQLGEILSEGEG